MRLSRLRVISRVDRGSCPPRPLTDPDVRDYRIRLLSGIGSLFDDVRTARSVAEEVDICEATGPIARLLSEHAGSDVEATSTMLC